MSTAHLALEQTPPLAVPLRFFLTAPWFGVLASLLLLYAGPSLFTDRWSLEMLALTHLVTLGFVSMVMMGAMLQLIPVLAGAILPSPRALSTSLHLLHSVGSFTLTLGLFISHPWLTQVGIVMLGLGFLLFLSVLGYCLTKTNNPIVMAMRLALVSLAVTVFLGIVLGSLFSNYPLAFPLSPMLTTHLHLTWGLMGWVGLLVIGVAYQVVPMFQITPAYPPLLMRWLVPSLLLGLVGWSLAYLYPLAAGLPYLLGSLMALGFAYFALTTLHLQTRRLRKLPDVTLNYWRMGMIGLLVSIGLWLGGSYPAPWYEILLGISFLGGFVLPLIQGMLYKIIPFLVWLHLQNRQLSDAHPLKLVKLPHMKQIIPDNQANRQFWLYLSGLLLLVGAVLGAPLLVYAAGSLLMVAFIGLGYNLYRALWLYLSVSRQFSS